MEYEKIAANEIGNLMNNLSLNPRKVVEEITKQHSTIQQSFTTLCLLWLGRISQDDYRYDGRNEMSHKVAKEIVEKAGIENFSALPLI